MNYSSPSIIHAQGSIEHNLLWHNLLKKIQNAPVQQSEPLNEELSIITYNSRYVRDDGWNYPNKTLGNAEMSMNKLSVPFIVLGQNTKKWQNTLKLTLAKTFLENSKKKYVLSLDSSDVLVLKNPNKVLNFFKTQPCKMLFNAEICPFMTGVMPDKWRKYEETQSNETFRYLNAGVWIAEKEYAIEFLETCINLNVQEMIENKQIPTNALHSEQVRIKCVALNNPNVMLDYKCQVFQTLFGINDYLKLI